MNTRPIITMDEEDESMWLVDPDHQSRPKFLGFVDGIEFHPSGRGVYTFATIRALADFLDQLAGANLLSGVRE